MHNTLYKSTIHGVWFIFRTAEYMFATAEYMFTTAEYMFRSAEYKTNACFVEISAGNETKYQQLS